MSIGREISRDFINRILLPVLQRELPQDYQRLAVAVVGTGSDVLGLDDEISRDHHWGPRASIFYIRDDADRMAPMLHRVLRQKLPHEFQGYDVRVDIDNRTGVCCGTVGDFFRRFLGTDRLPENELDWLSMCEVDLFHVTAGTVVYDGLGELTRRRDALTYYPENVWKKRLADWCMYITGREAPYNLHRVSKRGDDLTCTIYLGLCLKRLMEICFTLNRRYAPYTKWLNRTFRLLPRYADAMAPLIDRVLAESVWDQRVRLLIEANYVVADALADLGLVIRMDRREFDEGLTDLTLYDCAAQIYSTLPQGFLHPSFNQIELWESMARDVLFDANDYLRTTRESKC